MIDVERALNEAFRHHEREVRIDDQLLASAIGRADRRRHRRQAVGRVCLVLVLVTGAVSVVAMLRAERSSHVTTKPAAIVDLGGVDRLPPGSDTILRGPEMFVLRDTAGEIRAFSSRAPKQGCRLVLASDVAELHLAPNVVFHDPCRGENFDRDGRHVGGPPSLRNMHRFDVSTAGGRILVDTGPARPAMVMPAGTTVRTLLDRRLLEEWEAGDAVDAAFHLDDGRYVAEVGCGVSCRPGVEHRIVIGRNTDKPTKIVIPEKYGRLQRLFDAVESNGHAYVLYQAGRDRVDEGRLFLQDVDSGKVVNLGVVCCDRSIITDASYGNGVVVTTVLSAVESKNDVRIERVDSDRPISRACMPTTTSDRRNYYAPVGAAISPSADRVAYLYARSSIQPDGSSPRLWLVTCDLATGRQSRVDLGARRPPAPRQMIDFDGRFAVVSSIEGMPGLMVDTVTGRRTRVTDSGPVGTLADPDAIAQAPGSRPA